MGITIRDEEKKTTVTIQGPELEDAAWKILGPMQSEGLVEVQQRPTKIVATAGRFGRDELREAAEKLRASTATPDPEAPRRSKVRASSVEVGDTVNGYPVTGLGRAWVIDSEDNCVWGAGPDETVRVQYAYHR